MTLASTLLASCLPPSRGGAAKKRSGIALVALAIGVAAACAAGRSAQADERTGPAGLGATQNASPDDIHIPGVPHRVEPPGELPGGGIYVMVESAEVQGNPRDPASLYCSIDVSVYNFLPLAVADLVVAIDFTGPDGSSGSSLSVFHTLEPGSGDLDQFNQLPIRSCTGVAGKTRPVLCRTIKNDDCTGRVLGMRSGALALQ